MYVHCVYVRGYLLRYSVWHLEYFIFEDRLYKCETSGKIKKKTKISNGIIKHSFRSENKNLQRKSKYLMNEVEKKNRWKYDTEELKRNKTKEQMRRVCGNIFQYCYIHRLTHMKGAHISIISFVKGSFHYKSFLLTQSSYYVRAHNFFFGALFLWLSVCMCVSPLRTGGRSKYERFPQIEWNNIQINTICVCNIPYIHIWLNQMDFQSSKSDWIALILVCDFFFLSGLKSNSNSYVTERNT